MKDCVTCIHGMVDMYDEPCYTCGNFNSKWEPKEDDKMVKLDKTPAPLYNMGDVIDISYRNGGLPNRILIKGIRRTDDNGTWGYVVELESTHEVVAMKQEFITERKCKKTADVYDLKVVKSRYEEGWRFAGNFDATKAPDIARSIAESENVRNVRLTEAYDGYGKFANKKLAIWIRYMMPINNNGTIQDTGNGKVQIDIK